MNEFDIIFDKWFQIYITKISTYLCSTYSSIYITKISTYLCSTYSSILSFSKSSKPEFSNFHQGEQISGLLGARLVQHTFRFILLFVPAKSTAAV